MKTKFISIVVQTKKMRPFWLRDRVDGEKILRLKYSVKAVQSKLIMMASKIDQDI